MTDRGLKVFVSYRRENLAHARLLADNLKFQEEAEVSFDVESIPPGASFPEWIDREIATCDVVLVLIGDDWLAIPGPDGTPCIEDPKDWVHVEIQAALERGVLTIPILVEDAAMPRPDQLPHAISRLAHRNAVALRVATFSPDFERLASALRPVAAFERSSLGPRPATSWPARFTDAWFAANVPGLNSKQLDALRIELYKRSWTDTEIAERVLVHARIEPSPPQHATSQTAVEVDEGPWPERVTDAVSRAAVIEETDPVAQATVEAATDLEALDNAGRQVRERDLANAIARHLRGATVERRLRIPGWDPQPGNVDVFTTDWRGQPKLIIETKHKDGNDVFECLWDMAKVLSLGTERSVKGAYLVTGTTKANWARPVACAELFETGRHDLVSAIRHYADWWERYILGDSTGRPLAVPAAMDVALVARVPLTLARIAWELRAIRVSTPDANWIRFADGYPPAGT